MDIIIIILQTLIIINIVSFFVGYLIGNRNSINIGSTSSVFMSRNKEEIVKPKVSIDTTKYVTTIKTDSLEKKYDQLGDIKKSTDNIDSSVNKLKNMKG